jgi:indolepyruvate ferredoxin oxidoreductase alpha subunit
VVAVIGDSTYAHSGLTGLVNAVYNGGDSTIVVLDNRTTAMTGHQDNPVTGRTLMGEETPELDLEGTARALGAASVRVVDPHDMKVTEDVLREEVARPGVSFVVAKAPCALLIKDEHTPVAVDDAACTACGVCIRLGCPAISKAEDEKAFIDVSLCVGCGQCEQVCKFDAIVPAGPACDIGGGGP